MRILHCIHHLRGGGAERQLRLLANASAQYGMTAGVVCVNDVGRADFADTVPLFVARRTSHYDPRFMVDVHCAIRTFRPDLVHVWLPEIMTVPSMLMAALHRIPTVFSYRWAMHWHRPLALLEFVTAACCSRSIVSNHALSSDTRPYHWLFAAKNGFVIPNGVPTSASQPSTRQSKNATQPLQILFAGRLTAQKNWTCLIEALPLLQGPHSWRLSICGEGEDRPAIEARIAALDLSAVVEFRGYVSNLADVMGQSDVLVLPSWNEGMSNVMFEAFAAGLPCVASNIPQNRELTDQYQCAELFDPHTPHDLARVLNQVLHSPERRSQLRAAGQAVIRDYSVETMVARYAETYRNILGSPLSTSLQQRAA